TPSFSTAEAFDTMLAGRPVPQLVRAEWVSGIEARLARLLRIAPESVADSADRVRPDRREVSHG
ncbi:MAG: hypothetical protein ABI418_22030, partial [Jatrophihabitantaceae bacterium]